MFSKTFVNYFFKMYFTKGTKAFSFFPGSCTYILAGNVLGRTNRRDSKSEVRTNFLLCTVHVVTCFLSTEGDRSPI